MSSLNSFSPAARAVVFGASGGIGAAAVQRLNSDPAIEKIYCISRALPKLRLEKCAYVTADITDENALRNAAETVKEDGPIDLIMVLTGFLHDSEITPEKSARQMNMTAFEKNFAVYCFGPALVAKHFLPLMPRSGKSVFAALSARVGSISDNRLGGWYSYRSSKAALNMMIKTLSV